MSTITQIRPSTLEGIKRLAVAIKRERHLTHSLALDESAKAAGYQNFRHARSQIEREKGRGHVVYVTAYWRDSDDGSEGRETLRCLLDRPVNGLLSAREIAGRGLGGFRIDAADHLEFRHDRNSQSNARAVVCHAARTLQFIQATGLRPLTRGLTVVSRRFRSIPERDHESCWVNPSSKEVIWVDEPYRSGPEFLEARAAWAAHNGMAFASTQWPGMYVPGQSQLYLHADGQQRDALAQIARILDALPRPTIETKWCGESAPYAPVFISPARATSGKAKRGRPRRLARGTVRKAAISYGVTFAGGPPLWRPNARMPLSAHATAAGLLKRLLAWDRRTWDFDRILGGVRSQLDDWVQCEYSREELADDVFHELYYGKPYDGPANHSKRRTIIKLQSLITRHYPDCVPRRAMLRRLANALRLADRLLPPARKQPK